MEKVKLTKVVRTDRVSKSTGKPFVSLSIKTVQYGDKFLSGFGNAANAHWAEGQEVEIITERIMKDGKEYINFTVPKKEDKNDEKLEKILNKLTTLTLTIAAIGATLDELTKKHKTLSYPTPEDEGIDLSDPENF